MHPDTDAAAAAFAFAVPPMVVAPGEDRMDVPFIVSNVTLVEVSDDVSKYDLVPGEVRTATIPFPILDWGMGVLVSDPVESMIVVDALTRFTLTLFVRQSNSARAADVMRAILCLYFMDGWMDGCVVFYMIVYYREKGRILMCDGNWTTLYWLLSGLA